jgi:hypothetical protein
MKIAVHPATIVLAEGLLVQFAAIADRIAMLPPEALLAARVDRIRDMKRFSGDDALEQILDVLCEFSAAAFNLKAANQPPALTLGADVPSGDAA